MATYSDVISLCATTHLILKLPKAFFLLWTKLRKIFFYYYQKKIPQGYQSTRSNEHLFISFFLYLFIYILMFLFSFISLWLLHHHQLFAYALPSTLLLLLPARILIIVEEEAAVTTTTTKIITSYRNWVTSEVVLVTTFIEKNTKINNHILSGRSKHFVLLYSHDFKVNLNTIFLSFHYSFTFCCCYFYDFSTIFSFFFVLFSFFIVFFSLLLLYIFFF